MDEAIGSQITDYLIKPVNPNQVWLSLKKIIDNRRLVAEKTTSSYQQQFRELFMALSNNPDHSEWMEIYKKLVYWELEMKKAIVLKCRKFFNRKNRKPIRSSLNSFQNIILHGLPILRLMHRL